MNEFPILCQAIKQTISTNRGRPSYVSSALTITVKHAFLPKYLSYSFYAD